MQKGQGDNARPNFSDTHAVSEIVGSLVMIGVTVATVASFGLFLAAIDGPSSEIHVAIDSVISPGEGGWDTGDERISLRHLGGEDLVTADTRILVQIDDNAISFEAAELGGGFSDGVLQIGESWDTTISIPEDSDVVIFVIGQSDNFQHIVYQATPEVVA